MEGALKSTLNWARRPGLMSCVCFPGESVLPPSDARALPSCRVLRGPTGWWAVDARLSDHPQLVVEWLPRRPLGAPEGSWLGGALHLSSSGAPHSGDLEILQSLVPLAGLAGGSADVPGASLAFLASVNSPRSSGRLLTVSADFSVPARIEYGYLRTPDDRDRLREVVRTTAALLTTPAFQEISHGPVALPERVLGDDRALDRWITARLGTAQHTCGTVPFGPAVDPFGRVHGITGLRVADTSILPTAPLRGPAATAVLIGELIAHVMRHETP